MRLAFLAVVLVGCGGPSLAGNWSANITQGSTSYAVALVLTQQGSALGGSYANAGVSGTVSGSLTGESVSLSLSAPGYTPALVTAALGPDTQMQGTINGSGFNDAAFLAEKQ